MTHSERQIWLGQRLHPDSPLYNMAFAWVFDGDLRSDWFAEAWRETVDANPALRAVFVDRGGGPEKAFLDPGCSETETLDWSDRPDAERAFRAWTRERAARPLSPAGPQADSVLVQLGRHKTGWYLNQHHLITDARSTVLLFREVARRYAAKAEGREPAPRDPAPSRSAAAPRAGELQAAKEHWSRRMARPNRTIPMYGRDAAPADTRSRRCTIELDAKTSQALERLCDEPGFASLSRELSRFTLFSALLTSWLHRVSEQPEAGFDAPVAGRRTLAEKQMLGLFIEMFPFAVELEPGETFRSLAAKCMQEATLFLRHALSGLSAPSSAASSNVVLNFYPDSFGDFAGVKGTVEWVHPGHGDSVHALRVQVHDFNGIGRWVLHLDFNESAFPETLRRRALRHFEANLRALADDPDRPVATVDLRTEEERESWAALNDVWREPTPEAGVLERIWERAETEPDADALREGERRLGRRELVRRAEGLAAALVAAGVEPGDRVAIVAKRSIEAVVAILGVLRARGAYVPVDPSYPPARIRTILADSGPRVVLAAREITEAEEAGVPVLPIDAAGEATGLGREMPRLDDLAYVLYTSGTTGQPKGVLIEHGGLADYLEWAERTYVRGDRLVFPLFTSLSFDLTATSLFLPLMTGGVLEIYPEPDDLVDSTLQDVVRDNKVDFLKATPSHLSLMVRLGLEGSRIRRVVVGGEDFKVRLARQIQTQLGEDAEIYNEYGPTEAVVGCVVHRYRRDQDRGGSVPIGRPADHVEVEILNRAPAPVPSGVPGELWTTRFGLARGYHGRDELTAERFRDPPHRRGERWYRTGDRVRLSDEGRLEYLGRVDRQLKVAGHRVEPEEVEAALLELPQVEQCAVVLRRRRASAKADFFCVRCGLPSNYPDASFDADGVCRVCRSYDAVKEHASGYFKTMDELRDLFGSGRGSAPYDCMMLLSGGKDSTFALCKLVEMGLSVYALTLDNGYISEGAKENIRRVTAELGVPMEFATTPAMNAIFRDSLARYSNVCQGCFKTLYTLSVNRALELGVSTIVTGLSRGQMFETRLTEEMFRGGARSAEEVDAAVLAARKVYHRADDEVKRSLDVRAFEDDQVFERVRFVDFYRYCDVGLSEMLGYLRERVPWIRPEDTGRSTNCLINDVGIFVHKQQRGFHNYALPYSWDVRMGHKTRDEALDELDDEIDSEFVRKTLDEIGCEPERLMDERSESLLAAFYVAPEPIPDDEIRRRLEKRLPAALIPAYFERLDSIPTTAHGKADERALPQVGRVRSSRPFRAPDGPVAEYLAGVWAELLNVDKVGADDDFFGLGGASLAAMEVMIRLCDEFRIELSLDTVFLHPRLEDLARIAEDRILADVGLDEPGLERS